VLRAIRDIIVVNQFGALSVILMLTAFQVFVLGVIADVIVRRFQMVPVVPPVPDKVRLAAISVRSAASEPATQMVRDRVN